MINANNKQRCNTVERREECGECACGGRGDHKSIERNKTRRKKNHRRANLVISILARRGKNRRVSITRPEYFPGYRREAVRARTPTHSNTHANYRVPPFQPRHQVRVPELREHLFVLLHSTAFASATDHKPLCRADDYKYDFTECDSFGGRWRVSVPILPEKCLPGPESERAPVRVNKCYSSCDGGQYFNASSLLCENCPAGHYSLGGGIIIDSFNSTSSSASSSSKSSLPAGFRINTESTKHTPESNRLCNGWYVDPSTNQLVATMQSSTGSAVKRGPFDSEKNYYETGCISVVTYTVKVVKAGYLRFYYRYTVPDDFSSLLFTFNYRSYPANVDTDDDDSNSVGIYDNDDLINSNLMRFPAPTLQQNFASMQINFNRPGLYVFTWRSVLLGNLHRILSSKSTENFGNFVSDDSSNDDDTTRSNDLSRSKLAKSEIRIKKIEIEGVAYASECTPCEPGTFAANAAQRQCDPCPSNTANSEFGATHCAACDAITEYSARGSVHCRKRPICGTNDFYAIPIGRCDLAKRQQAVRYRWIEPRICVDTNRIFPTNTDGVINCTASAAPNDGVRQQCDLGMESKPDISGREFCQFCAANQYRRIDLPTCEPCPPFTAPYYALSVLRWNASLPAWSIGTAVGSQFSINSSSISEDYFSDNYKFLNAFFSRQCIRGEEDADSSTSTADYYSGSSTNSLKLDECDPRVSWQPFDDHIRTGASALLDSYLILSINIPGFRSATGGEISFVFETNCSTGDRCSLLFVETKLPDQFDFQDFSGKQDLGNYLANSPPSQQQQHRHVQARQSMNDVVKEWSSTMPGSGGGRQSFRYKIDRNVSVSYSWIFKRSTSFQSYAKLYSVLLTNSLIGGAIECHRCPFQSQSTPNQCVTCSEGKYLDVGTSDSGAIITAAAGAASNRSIPLMAGNYECKHCPPNHVLNRSVALPLGAKSCLACGTNLVTDNRAPSICYSNCTVQFAEDRYDLSTLPQPLQYYGGNLFTATGTEYLHLIKISLCGHPKFAPMSTCVSNITQPSDSSSSSSSSSSLSSITRIANSRIRAYICRNTIIPDEKLTYSSQPISLGDQLLGISRDNTFANITVHPEFLQKPSSSLGDIDYHLFYSTNTPTSSCTNGRRLTITMRCNRDVAKIAPHQARITTPRSCPDGTCDGCNFHLLLETGTAAACRLCRPRSNDYDTVLGECVDGQQKVHFINPSKRCTIPTLSSADNRSSNDSATTDFVIRSCTVLLPRQVQIGIAVVCAFGLLLVLLVFHFWNQNRSLEYKYSKLIESAGDGSRDDDLLDNCCAEDRDDDDSQQQQRQQQPQQLIDSEPKLIFSSNRETNYDDNDRNIAIDLRGKANNSNIPVGQHNNRATSADIKSSQRSHQMRPLFSDKSHDSQSTIALLSGPDHHRKNKIDDEGYETIHLTSPNVANQTV